MKTITIPENATRREVFKSIFGFDVPRDIDLCGVFEKCKQCPLKDQESCTVERDFNPWFDELYTSR